MRKTVSILLALIILISCCTACAKKETSTGGTTTTAETTVPETTVSDTTVSDTTVTDTTVTDTTLTDTTVTDTTTPETTMEPPSTTPPQTDPPATSKQETTKVETTAPETEPPIPQYVASFYADGKLVSKVTFKQGDTSLKNVPKVPSKEGYFCYWEEYKLDNKDIRIDAVYKDGYTVRIVADDPDAFTFKGLTEQKITVDSPDISQVTIVAQNGYKLDYYEIKGVKYTGKYINSYTCPKVTEDLTIVVYAKPALSELPVIYIDTNDVKIKDKETYTDMVFDIKNCDNPLRGIEGGIRLRGNSTLNMAKKAYRIKFDKKQSLFGLEKAKSWVLLADYIDPSTLRNHAALTIGNQMPGLGFVPSPHKVNVYLNGKYQGVYTLCEQVQENEGRLNIEMDAITADMTDFKDYNWLLCLDYSSMSDPSLAENEDWFTIPGYGSVAHLKTLCFELKYPEKEDFPSEEQFRWFFEELKKYIKEVVEDFHNKDVGAISSKTNIISLIDFAIVDQIIGETDHTYKSFNFYYTCTSENPEENNKINFGPIWDYDHSLHAPWTGKPNVSYNVSGEIRYGGPFYGAVYEIEEFYQILAYRFKTYGKPALEAYIAGFDAMVEGMKESLEKNRSTWYTSYPSTIVEDNIKLLKDTLVYRNHVLTEKWK